MKPILLTLLLMVCVVASAHAQEAIVLTTPIAAKVAISNYTPGPGRFVGGATVQ